MFEKTTRHQEKVPEKQKTMERYTDEVFAKPIRQKSRQPSLIRGTSDPSRLCPVSSAFRKFLVERRETLPRSSRTRTLQPFLSTRPPEKKNHLDPDNGRKESNQQAVQ